MDINDVCDYIIVKLDEGGGYLNLLKLQKLVYYAQAWHLAFFNQPLFSGKFQAWIHGPVSRQLYDRFLATKSLYSPVGLDDVRKDFDPEEVPEDARAHIDSVLEVYAPLTGSQLEDLTHREAPWVKARENVRPNERCERELDEGLMARYYASRLPAGN